MHASSHSPLSQYIMRCCSPVPERIYASPRSWQRSGRQAPLILDTQRVAYPYAQGVWRCVPAQSHISHFPLVTMNIKEAFSEIWISFQQLGIQKPITIFSSFSTYPNKIASVWGLYTCEWTIPLLKPAPKVPVLNGGKRIKIRWEPCLSSSSSLLLLRVTVPDLESRRILESEGNWEITQIDVLPLQNFLK